MKNTLNKFIIISVVHLLLILISGQVFANVSESTNKDLLESAQSENQQDTKLAETLSNKGKTISDPKKLKQLENSYKELRNIIKTQDAYSFELGEHYFAYANLLKSLERYEEAIDAYSSAAHITKINEGLYSLKQRPALKELFESYLALNNKDAAEDTLNKILWIEGQNGDVKDKFSFEVLISLSHKYIDQYFKSNITPQEKLAYLEKASNFLLFSISKYETAPLSDLMPPYGELALARYLQKSLVGTVNRGRLTDEIRQRNLDDSFVDSNDVNLVNAYRNGKSVLEKYVKKSIAEESDDQLVLSLLALADFNYLFGKTTPAIRFYNAVYKEAVKNNDEQLLQTLAIPHVLPNFNYAIARERFKPENSIDVPLLLVINRQGNIASLKHLEDTTLSNSILFRAKKKVRKLVFRPAIVDGKTSSSEEFLYTTSIVKPKSDIEVN